VLQTNWQQAALYRPVAREPVVPQIVTQLREHILLGKLGGETDRLPALWKLAQLFGVSIPTVRAAVQTLAYLGVVQVRHGVGTFVVRNGESHRATLAGLRHARPEELFELRGLLEVRAAQLMAESMPRDERYQPIIDLHWWLWERRVRREHRPGPFIKNDIAFHYAVLVGSGSAYAASLHQQVCDRLHQALTADARRQVLNPELDELHMVLYEVIERGQADEAADIAGRIVELERPHRPEPQA
jgi:GntR family transcriptional repressor for pyruvate dehydrogenase complex